MSEEKAFNCKHCGKCCIVHTSIPVKKRETKKYGYKTKEYRGKKTKKEYRILARKRAFLKEVGKFVFMCVYFDHLKKACEIYSKRPKVCRVWQCDREANVYGSIVQKQWNKLTSGKAASCLSG